MCLTAEMSVVCLSMYVRLNKICYFNPHTGFYFAFNWRQFGRFDAHNTWHSLQRQVKSLR